MADKLDSDQTLVEPDESSGSMKATPYFEDFLFQLVADIGGEGGDTPTDALNLFSVNRVLPPRVNQIRRDLDELGQLVSSLNLNPKINNQQRIIASLEQVINTSNGLRGKVNGQQRRIEDLNQLVAELMSRNGRLYSLIKDIGFTSQEIVTGATTGTTNGNQLWTCNNSGTATLTLNTTPRDKEQLHISRRNALVNLVGVVDGVANPSIAAQFDAPHLSFSTAAGEWMTI